MLFRIDSQSLEVEEAVYDFISQANSDTYEPSDADPG